ncbi:hypothetical protein C5U62_31980 [Pseudomonas protegens]|uniref:DNA-binding protein n=1 Tax=Pseudomonas protegens TaxID=380021 RepID=A0A2T6GBC2_9PSED|nr:Rha family transcriptional regulator [Pseudomonas protegens]PUA41454.1 hypothetical protein C5U62_31980 [Pseudomonas protegens]
MNNLISSAVTMTSHEIAGLVEKRHDNVKRTIETLASSGVIVRPQIEDEPGVDTMGRERITQVYRFEGEQGKRDSIIVVAQLCPEFTAALVDRWRELETKVAQPTIPQTLPEALRLAADLAEKCQQLTTERDHAVQTKAQIGSRREAQSMAAASAAVRQVKRLNDELGHGTRFATVTAVELATGTEYPKNVYVPLRKWCKDHDVTPEIVPDKRFGQVKAWPAAAWMEVYGVDLQLLFTANLIAGDRAA